MSKIVAVTGGSASGKTTIARALAARLHTQGAVVIAEDDYYHCSSDVPDFDPAAYNFDAPEAKDHALLRQHLLAAKSGEPFDKPIYDLVTHRRRADLGTIGSHDIIIVEGIHLLTSVELRALFDVKVYVEADEALRLGRRMLRDVEERGRAPRAVLDQFFKSVRPMHEKYIAPQKAHADLVLRCAYGAGPEEADANAAQIEARLNL